MRNEKIKAAIEALSGNYSGLKLARLAKAISHRIEWSEAREALLELERAEEVALYPCDNPREITAEDREFAIENSGGFARHIVYIVR